METYFRYTTSDGHNVTYTIGRRGFTQALGADTKEGIEAAKREVWAALAEYRRLQAAF